MLPAVDASARPAPVRVIVVDDSAIARGMIIKFLERDPDVAVVGRAPNGEAAIAEVKRTDADIVVLDIEMPVMDGLTALPFILKARPGVKVIIASSVARRSAKISLEALQIGASDYVPKPDGGRLGAAEDFADELLRKVKALGAARAPRQDRPAPVALRSAPAAATAPLAAVVIGGSTGAPPALMAIAKELRGALEQPILVAQHMPPTFTTMLAEQLERAYGAPAAEGQDGEPVLPGRIYLAPGGWHMTVAREGEAPVIRLNQEPPEHYCRPSVNPLLRSAAQVYGAGVLAAILTGMGGDGAEGCRAVAGAGGRFIVQDKETSVVWGMPGAAAKTGLASAVLPLSEIAAFIRRAAEKNS